MRDPARSTVASVAEPTGLVGSVRRALHVLETVAAAGDGITAKAVARRLGLKLPTTYHLLNTLVYEGYLVRLNIARGYGLGYKLAGLDRELRRQLDVTPGIAQVLRVAHDEARAATYYTVFRDDEIVIAEVADSEQAPRVQPLDVGFGDGVQGTAFGKVLLAAMSPSRRRAYLAGAGLPRLTPYTRTSQRELEPELERVRTAGLAEEIEEFRPGLSCLAAPVYGDAGEITGAVAVSLSTEEFMRRRPQLERVIRHSATRVCQLLAMRSLF